MKILSIIAGLLFLAGGLRMEAQAAASSCETRYGAFLGYSPNASPKVTGGALIATLFPGTKCATGFQLMSYTQYIESPVKLSTGWTLQQTISTGAALPLRTLNYDSIELWALGTVGASVTGSTSTAKLGTTFGFGASVPIFKGQFKLFPAYEKVNSGWEILIGVIH